MWGLKMTLIQFALRLAETNISQIDFCNYCHPFGSEMIEYLKDNEFIGVGDYGKLYLTDLGKKELDT